ncbi:hypothetical protein F0562_032735 [Nyssa sinensis]|uniref:Uncharacterized protein n=1 Tax=Nyssa sinensis TaxID=561372 RepID=A0A5J5ASL1_9ASTE|nr:hypothetical protein F0562_032735 [Nyssa sinensis]
MIGDFEAGMNCLQNPPLLSRSFSLFSAGKMLQVYSVWKWGALILALVATLSGILIKRIKLVFIRFRRLKPLGSSEPLLHQLDDDYDFSDDDGDTCSSASSEDEGYESTSSFEDREAFDEDFRVAGSCSYRDGQWCSSGGDRLWSDFTTGKGVKISDSGRFHSRPRLVFLSAEIDNSNNFAFGLYDTRVGRQIPAIFAEWWPKQGKILGIKSGGVEKVYFGDEVTGALTVGDMRNVKTPLHKLTESDGDTWWDADTGIVPDKFVDDFSR